MTPKESFWAAYKRVTTALVATPDQAHAAECWTIIAPFAPELYDLAATRLIANSRFLPKPSEWLDACRQVKGERDMERVRQRQLEADKFSARQEAWCQRCQDTGWVLGLRCPDPLGGWCGRCKTQGHHLYDHTYTRACDCRERNPVYLAKRERQRAMSHGKGQQGNRQAA